MAYSSLESGQIEVYVRPFPGPGGKWLISTAGGTHPIFSTNGHERFYREYRTGKIMVVSYTINGDSFVPGEPTVWSEKRVYGTANFTPMPYIRMASALRSSFTRTDRLT